MWFVADLERERFAAPWRWLRCGCRKTVDHLDPKQTWIVVEIFVKYESSCRMYSGMKYAQVMM